MRRAELYEVKKTEINIYEGQEEIRFLAPIARDFPLWLSPTEVAVPTDATELVISVPVFRLTRRGSRDRYIARLSGGRRPSA